MCALTVRMVPSCSELTSTVELLTTTPTNPASPLGNGSAEIGRPGLGPSCGGGASIGRVANETVTANTVVRPAMAVTRMAEEETRTSGSESMTKRRR